MQIQAALSQIVHPARVLTSHLHRIAYANDASYFRLVPQAVVQPDSTAEIQSLFKFTQQKNIPMVFRAAGTSLSGQAVTDGILVDISKHWGKYSVEESGKRIRFQPGIVGGFLSNVLKPYDRRIGPDHRGEFYMIPETAQNRSIEVYRCTRFPDQWTYHKSLMQNLRATDTTLFEHSGLWWMFVNIVGEGGSTWDELHLFHSDDPLSEQWTPHPMNPVVSDVRTARPAGRVFRRDGLLLRPSQDSSRRYGYALNINRINKLTTSEFEEELLERLEPPEDGKIPCGAHVQLVE